MIARTILCLVSVTFIGGATVCTQDKPPATSYFEQDVKDSNPLRTEQAQELDNYILALKKDNSRLQKLLPADYSSPQAFEKSAQHYRQAFCDSIGYPPPGDVPQDAATFHKMGEDSIGTYFRAKIPILPGVYAEGIYIVPKTLKENEKAPLVISMHGGGGSPEVALFRGGANYRDMVRGGVKRGYVVFAPQHLFSAEGFPKDVRNRTDERLRLVGTSLTAVEIAKITRSLDVLLKRPEVDATRVAMVGLSYGGYYALVTPALEPRIKVSVCSCYYGVQEGRYARDELSIPSDFKFQDRFTLFRDSDIAALICPRALQIQAGSKDGVDHRDAGKLLAPQSAGYYSKLGLADRFEHLVFEGGHEFHDPSAWEFVKKHL
ncbi:MAG: dienelactone hydrolase family protein [Planctomycetaceae bacterium]|nr:dienelactone hydrolase family protein [Planctomycetaceae bacterium]